MSFANRFAVVLVSSTTLLGLTACSDGEDLAARQAAVAEAGADVMPFDLDATTHVFTTTDSGGIQDVIADDASDSANIALIEVHLAEEAAKFQAGDFSDPEAIHGPGMPGLSVLKERYQEVEVDLLPHSEGATLTFSASDPEVVEAIHAWFDAQVSDHGEHAEHANQ